ncbi:MAG: type II toxin-antitoxin system prevent-host-death family antitoxin [Sulfurisoma sp.]|nr:type II toxin-antitoxin system prevent-host-death family antitoxin [Sulfurisoma sp.]
MSAIALERLQGKNLGEVFADVYDTKEPCIVTRGDGRDVVIVPADEWAAISETLHLMSSAANTERLRESIAQADAGKRVSRQID